jgi:hypothetical protein
LYQSLRADLNDTTYPISRFIRGSTCTIGLNVNGVRVVTVEGSIKIEGDEDGPECTIGLILRFFKAVVFSGEGATVVGPTIVAENGMGVV